MPILPRPLPLLAAVLLAGTLLPAPRARAQDDEPPAAQPADLYDQTDRKKTMMMKLPRSWKPLKDEVIDGNKALAGFSGFFGEEKKSPNGAVLFNVLNQYTRSVLARAMELPGVGPVKKESARQGPGWAEGCAVGDYTSWRRYVEKNGRVYRFEVQAAAGAWDAVHAEVEKLLDTATLPGEYAPPSLGDNFKQQKGAGFEVISDASPDREKSITKALSLLSDGREALAKALPGKLNDTGKPLAWIFQNGQKYEDRVKAAIGVAPEHAAFCPTDRAAEVKIIRETADEYQGELYYVGAKQYVWQYFGGETPMWLHAGLANYGQLVALGGGKGKFRDSDIASAKAAVAAGKRRFDNWLDLVDWNEVKDNDQGNRELFAWQVYFRSARGAKKYKKHFEGYVQTLHDKCDPGEARKAFDGVNFEEMLADFKAWAAEWK